METMIYSIQSKTSTTHSYIPFLRMRYPKFPSVLSRKCCLVSYKLSVILGVVDFKLILLLCAESCAGNGIFHKILVDSIFNDDRYISNYTRL
ncbi:hypothetical protein HETIRDRAFT_319251 [Heterobasidion irregulare TC 32-1]|uniref:Uncharacterized protein n=1 Tax=Heterobasidion irregulare (strain TC 32-1) TaxID=747525 RepID=W4K3Z5_HETIT|nr:uncharacterized protein HETIRDRAFT_319251 [Heterobasidion irregulare TC 32-1]ETW80464.1 hypothetical protein HETIRDRAFT_319251 [Heterobasidion irregulare TC 32-1]